MFNLPVFNSSFFSLSRSNSNMVTAELLPEHTSNAQLIHLRPDDYGWNESCGSVDAYFLQLKTSLEHLKAYLPEEIFFYLKKQTFQIFAQLDWQKSLEFIKNRGIQVFIEDSALLFSNDMVVGGSDFLAMEHFIEILQIFKSTVNPLDLDPKTRNFLGSLLRAAAELDHNKSGCALTSMLVQWGANLDEPSITSVEKPVEYIIKNENLLLLNIYFESGYKASWMAAIALKLNKTHLLDIVKVWNSEKIKSESQNLRVKPYQVAQRSVEMPISENSFEISDENIFQLIKEIWNVYKLPKKWYSSLNGNLDREKTLEKLNSIEIPQFCEQFEKYLLFASNFTNSRKDVIDKLMEIFRFKLARSSHLNYRFQTKNSQKFWGNFLNYCVEFGHPVMAVSLIKMGARVKGESLYIMAAQKNDRRVIKELFDRGEDFTPLMNWTQETTNKEINTFLVNLIIGESNNDYFRRTGNLIRL